MTDAALEVLLDGFDRVRETTRAAVHGLTEQQLTHRVGPGSNTVAWLAWHLVRVQDDHVAEVAGTEQVWTAGGWQQRFGLPFPADVIGYGQSEDEVRQVQGVSADLYLDYLDAVHRATTGYLHTLSAQDLSRVVDEGWDPPVTLSMRLVSVISDDLQHAGQAAFVRGLLTHGLRST